MLDLAYVSCERGYLLLVKKRYMCKKKQNLPYWLCQQFKIICIFVTEYSHKNRHI